MAETLESIRDRILESVLPEVEKYGWDWSVVLKAAACAGYQDSMAEAVFPGGLSDVVACFSDRADRQMLEQLSQVSPETMRVRDRIRTAILTRFKVLAPYRTTVRLSLAFWALPTRVLQGQRVLWRTADRIWTWAGDTSTDYNRQTKRGLLCSILLGSSLVWIDDASEGNQVTSQFVDRRIENVMEIGRALGTMSSTIPNLKRQQR